MWQIFKTNSITQLNKVGSCYTTLLASFSFEKTFFAIGLCHYVNYSVHGVQLRKGIKAKACLVKST